MRLADDHRGRVPFALVGVVLLVSSAAFATTVGTRSPPETNAPTRAAEEATAVARTALERAVSSASHAAARDPLVEPANTTFGRAIDNESPFADYLRVRIYLAARGALDRATARVGDSRATVSLPEITDTESLRRAKQRIRIREFPGARPWIAVTFRNASVVVRQGDRTLERRRYSPTVAVRTPVMVLHRRTETFERRLTRSPVDGGLSARVTGRLAAVAWGRGLAQYGGGPIANVVANRHLGLVTNGALLDVQRGVFGRADPAGERAHSTASARVAGEDLLAGITDSEWTEAVLGQTAGSGADAAIGITGRNALEGNRPSLTVGVNRTADTAFRTAVGRESPGLERVVDEIYTADVWLRTRSRVLGRNTTGPTRPETDGWTLVAVTNATETSLAPANASALPSPDRGHRLASFARTVTVTRRVVRTWRRGGRSRQTVAVERTRHLVRVGVFGRHATSTLAPRRGIQAPHTPGGPLDGRNFAGVRQRAVERLLGDGGLDETARKAVRGPVDRGPISLDVPPPEGIDGWLYRDLVTLRERVRDLSVQVDRRTALTGDPERRLRETFRTRRDGLTEAPTTYPSVAAKARVAARTLYLDTVGAGLEARVERTGSFRDRLRDRLGDHNLSTPALFDRLDTAGSGPDTTTGSVVTGVRGEPPYLTASAVTPEHTGAVNDTYYPLVARNLNLFANPHGDLGAGIAETLVPSRAGAVSLRTAGRALRVANHTLRNRTARRLDNTGLHGRRDRLTGATRDALDTVRSRLRNAVLGAGSSAPPVADSRPVDAGFREWDTVHGRALAAANGSLAGAVARSATPDNASAVRRDRVELRLRVALGEAVRDTGVAASTVGPVDNATTEIARAAVAGGIAAARDSWTKRAVRPSLSGLPLAPVPGWWYATLNVWTATVKGRYARFAVRAPAASPVPARNLTYVRRAAAVAVDVNGDGDAERLGRNRPVSFVVETAVPVVVPPRPPGVGDGERAEESSGWPAPGPE